MEMTNALSGVEITEESRYIDHTNATPFEENCAEIQRYLKRSIATVASEKRIVNQSAGQSMTTVLKYVDTSTTEEGIGEDVGEELERPMALGRRRAGDEGEEDEHEEEAGQEDGAERQRLPHKGGRRRAGVGL